MGTLYAHISYFTLDSVSCALCIAEKRKENKTKTRKKKAKNETRLFSYTKTANWVWRTAMVDRTAWVCVSVLGVLFGFRNDEYRFSLFVIFELFYLQFAVMFIYLCVSCLVSMPRITIFLTSSGSRCISLVRCGGDGAFRWSFHTLCSYIFLIHKIISIIRSRKWGPIMSYSIWCTSCSVFDGLVPCFILVNFSIIAFVHPIECGFEYHIIHLPRKPFTNLLFSLFCSGINSGVLGYFFISIFH